MKRVYGFGINDANYEVRPRVDGVPVMCRAYRAWYDMLRRCYSKKYQAKHPTYIGVIVCDEWRSFMSFRKWWIDNHVDGWNLDKDLLSDSRSYSPESCIYVPHWLNSFTIDCGANRGDWPIGASFHKQHGKFVSYCNNPEIGKRESLGYFTSPNEAHMAWKSRKLELSLEMNSDMDEIDERIYPRVVEIITKAT